MNWFVRNVKHFIKDPKWFFGAILFEYLAPLFPDKMYIRMKSKYVVGYKYNLDNPKTFNEKMNWLKLNDHNPRYTDMVDKVKAKKLVASLIGDEYVVPLIKVWDRAEEVDFSILPEKCILKTNQDSGGAIKYYKGSETKGIIKKLNGRMHLFNYYYYSREWPYRGVEKKIFAEEMLGNLKQNEVLNDYKFWCFNGVPQVMYVTCKSDDVFENFYDMDFKPLPIYHGSPRRSPEFERPAHFEKMKELAATLSKDIPFVRVDFFYVDGKIYFAEFTFFDWGGFRAFNDDWDLRLGNYLKLPDERNN